MSLKHIALAIAVVLAGLSLACGGGGGKKPQPTVVATQTPSADGAAEQVLAQYVQTSSQKAFVADCKNATPANDQGKVCATMIGERDNQRAYKLGPTFSEPTEWVILQQSNGQWTKVASYPITSDTASVPGIPWPLKTGVDLVVAAQPDPCLNVREGPSLGQKAVDCIANGTKIRLTAGPTIADGINWWQVEGRNGWVAGDYLRYPDAAQ